MSTSVSFPWTFPISWTAETVGGFAIPQMALTAQVLDIGPTFTSLPNLAALSIRRGRQSILDRFEPGTATLTFRNVDGRYWPHKTDGPYYGGLAPSRPVTIKVTYNAVEYTLFTGYVDGFYPGWQSEPLQGATMTIKCVDAMGTLRTWFNDPAIWWFLGAYSETAGRLAQIVMDYSKTRPWPAYNYPTMDMLIGNDAIYDEGRTIGAPGVLNMHRFIASKSGTVNEVIYNVGPVNGSMKFALYSDSAGEPDALLAESTEITNGSMTGKSVMYQHVPITATAVTAGTAYWLAYNSSTTGTYSLFVNSIPVARRYKTLAYASGFPDPAGAGYTSSTEMGPTARFCASLCDIDAGTSTIQSLLTTLGTQDNGVYRMDALEYLRRIAESEAGQFYLDPTGRPQFEGRSHRITTPHDTSLATFGSGALEMKYRNLDLSYDREFLYNEIRLQRVGGIEQKAYDQDSIDQYGRRVYSKLGYLNVDDADVANHADWLLSRYKDPAMRLKAISLLPAADPANLYPKALGYDISDRITVKLDDAGINDDFFIEGVSHDWQVDGTWRARWQLQQAWDAAY